MSRYGPPIRRNPIGASRPNRSGPIRSSKAQPRHLSPRAIYALANDDSTILEPGYNQDEFFDDQFERRAHEIQQTPGAGDAMSIIPSKAGPWTGNNQLGIERHFAPDANNLQSILKMAEWGFPEIWTLALGLTFDHHAWSPVGGASASFDVTALIDFGIGGVIQHVEIDWLNGAAISLPMNALNVVAQYNLDVATEAAGASDPPDDLRLRASICHGPLFQAKPTRTMRTTSVSTVDIPPFARTLKICLTDANEVEIFSFYSQTGTVEFNSGTSITPGIVLASYTFGQFVQRLSLAESTIGCPVPIDVPTGARSVVFNGDPGLLNNVMLAQFGIGV